MDPTAVTIRPRFVWGRRPRANGGRRRPRGREGFEKYPPVVSRGSYPASTKHTPPAPRLEEFPLFPVNPTPPTGIPNVDAELNRLSLMYGEVERMRRLIVARADVLLTLGGYLPETTQIWNQHDRLLRSADGLREQVMLVYGVQALAPPEHFYSKF